MSSPTSTEVVIEKTTQLDDLLALDPGAPRERATWVYNTLRDFLDVPASLRTDRLLRLSAEIDSHPRGAEIREILHDFWSHHSYIRVISEAGLPNEVFFLPELLARALRHLTPVDEVQGDLYILLDSLNLTEADAQWVASLPDSVLAWWADIFRPSPSSILVSCKLLAMRVTSVALSRDFLTLADDEDVAQSSFFTLPPLVEHLVRNPEDYPQWEIRRDACEARLREVTDLLEQRGSSASLVFRVRLLRSLLWRIQQVLNLQRDSSDSRKFAVTIVHGFAAQRKVGGVLSASTRRLARSVVEKTGRVGTHYIAKNSAQWKTMGRGAILAGVITCFTALFKYSISSLIHAPLLVAVGHSLNYAISFLLMQAGGFLLASKMPAATASTLVDAMEDPNKDHLASLQAISQTQTVVTIGNIFGAVLSSIAVDRIWNAVAHHPFLPPEHAAYGVEMLHPLLGNDPLRHRHRNFSLALFPRHRLDRELSRPHSHGIGHRQQSAHSPPPGRRACQLHRSLGEASRRRFGRICRAGIPSGFSSDYCWAVRIPLEVRHVTLAAASLGYALDAVWISGALHRSDVIFSFVGIFLVGVLNIVTSFALSFLLAVRARDIREAKARLFLKEVLKKLASHPVSFLLPEFGEN